jgi:hypothetical protein
MQYGKIISTGFSQAWKYKTLWFFGFFVAGGGTFNFGNWGEDSDIPGLGGRLDPDYIRDFLVENIAVILIVLAFAFLAMLLLMFLNIVSIGGLIDGARQIKRERQYSFTEAFNGGLHYFWRLLGISLLTLVIIIAVMIFLILVGVIAFVIHWGVGVLSLVILIPIFIVVAFMVTITVALAERMIVIEDRPVFDALGDAYSLWTANFGNSVAYTFIYLGISIAIMFGTFLVLIPVGLPFVAGLFVATVPTLIIGIPIILLILLVIRGYTGSAMHLMTTEFYFQLIEPPQPAVATTTVYGGTPPSPPPSPPMDTPPNQPPDIPPPTDPLPDEPPPPPPEKE